MGTHNLCFEQKYEEYKNFPSENFHFLVVNFSVYLNRHIFVMDRSKALVLLLFVLYGALWLLAVGLCCVYPVKCLVVFDWSCLAMVGKEGAGCSALRGFVTHYENTPIQTF